MMRTLILVIFSFLLHYRSEAQTTRYIVKLKHKGGTTYSIANPSAYLSTKAIARRTKYNIAIDSTDLPPTPQFITQIGNVSGVTILNISKWLNSVTIKTSDPNAISTINGFAFVESISGVAPKWSTEIENNQGKFESINETIAPTTSREQHVEADYYNYGASSFNEIHLHNGEFLHNIGLRGQNMQIAMHDAGFFNYTTLKAFDSVNLNGQVLSTWDFVNREVSVIEDNAHGMQCFSTIAANIPGQFVGKAPKASFHLYRTEDVNGEYVIEEHNWVCGAERADSVGADVITSSLGYTTFDLPGFDHAYADRNGDVAMASIGADLAAKKGLLVFNSVGNIRDAESHFLAIPADGDSVVAVGSVSAAGEVASNSSYGPSPDGRVKPDVASVGVNAVIQTSANTIGTGSGTSFAGPNMAGLATCLWQGFPEVNNMRIVSVLRQSGSKSSNPDDRVGYGIPDMKTAFGLLITEFATSSASINSCAAAISWTSKDVSAMKYEVERKLPGESVYTKVGEVNAQAGILLATRNYVFNNAIISPTPGIISYRIRQVIDTSAAGFRAVYIDTANATTASGCFATGIGNPPAASEMISVRPNPVMNNTLTLVIETTYAIPKMPVQVFDNKGRLVMQLSISKGSGTLYHPVEMNTLPAGKYYIKVYNGEKLLGSTEVIKL